MNNEPTPKRKDKRYDLTFKRSAVELWLAGGKSAEAARFILRAISRELDNA